MLANSIISQGILDGLSQSHNAMTNISPDDYQNKIFSHFWVNLQMLLAQIQLLCQFTVEKKYVRDVYR